MVAASFIIALVALGLAFVALSNLSKCQDDTDDHNEMLADLKSKLREKGIL